MKENKAPLHAHHTTGEAKFQEESIRQQIARQDSIIQQSDFIIEKAESDKALAITAKEFFLSQLSPNSHPKPFASPLGLTGENSVDSEILKLLAITPKDKGIDLSGIHEKLPMKVSKGTLFRSIKRLLKKLKIQQVNQKSKRNRRFILA